MNDAERKKIANDSNIVVNAIKPLMDRNAAMEAMAYTLGFGIAVGGIERERVLDLLASGETNSLEVIEKYKLLNILLPHEMD